MATFTSPEANRGSHRAVAFERRVQAVAHQHVRLCAALATDRSDVQEGDALPAGQGQEERGTYALPGFEGGGPEPVATPWGEALVSRGTFAGTEVLHVSRHEAGHAFNSHLFAIARQLLRAADERPKPNGERLPGLERPKHHVGLVIGYRRHLSLLIQGNDADGSGLGRRQGGRSCAMRCGHDVSPGPCRR